MPENNREMKRVDEENFEELHAFLGIINWLAYAVKFILFKWSPIWSSALENVSDQQLHQILLIIEIQIHRIHQQRWTKIIFYRLIYSINNW